MARSGFPVWRVYLALSALFILVGAPQHPGGTMAEMLADPAWFLGHALMFVGFVLLAPGLALYGRSVELPAATRTWLRIAVVGTVLQAVEMAVHTMAYVDAANLIAGRPTPVLTTHLWLTVALYPIFGITMAGLLHVTWRERTLGAPWVNWVGILGALGHGAAGPLVVAFNVEWARLLFPMVALVGLWALVAALLPLRNRAVPGTTARQMA